MKVSVFGLLCLIILPTQTLSLFLLGRTRFYFIVPFFFHRATCFIFRIKTQVQGSITHGHVVYVGNHLSYIDIPVLGSILKAVFISKASVKTWPVFGWLAAISKTIFIERNRSAATKAINDIESSLVSGRSLILIPEGTSTNGVEVLAFKSSVFELFLNKKLKTNLVVQPFTITLTGIDNERPPANVAAHDLYAWYGDMELPPHLWALAQSKGANILVTFHPPHAAADYDNRKEFANDCQKDVARGLKNTQARS